MSVLLSAFASELLFVTLSLTFSTVSIVSLALPIILSYNSFMVLNAPVNNTTARAVIAIVLNNLLSLY